MKVSSLFNLITDINDILDFFEHVETPEQLVSRLERLKRANTEELLACIEGARGSVSEALDDTLEMSAALDDDDEEDDESGGLLSDAELEDLAKEVAGEPEEKQNPEPVAAAVEDKIPAA